MKFIVLTSAFIAAFSAELNAQSHLLLQKQYRSQISLSYGLQPNMALRTAYARQWNGRMSPTLFAAAEMGFIQTVQENHALQVGGQIGLYKKNNFLIVNELSVETGHLETKIYRARKWELNELLTAGWYGQRTGFALLAGYTQNMGVHLEHSDFYRETAYSDAKDGWYGGLGAYWQAGFRVNRILWQRFDLSLQMTYAQSRKGYSIGALPAFVQLGGGWRF